jgi:hypothetical protein
MLLWTYPPLVWSQIFSNIYVYSTLNQRTTIVESVKLRIATFWIKMFLSQWTRLQKVYEISLGSLICCSQGVAASSYHVPVVQHTWHSYYCWLLLLNSHYRTPTIGGQHSFQKPRVSPQLAITRWVDITVPPGGSDSFHTHSITKPTQPTIQAYITYNTSSVSKPSKFSGYQRYHQA